MNLVDPTHRAWNGRLQTKKINLLREWGLSGFLCLGLEMRLVVVLPYINASRLNNLTTKLYADKGGKGLITCR